MERERDELKAVITFGKPASPSLCKGVCGSKWSNNVYELNRLCRTDDFKQPLSHLVGYALKALKDEDWIIVSYSDTAMHHNGYIYQACNFLYTGQTKARTDIYTGEGKHSRHYDESDMNCGVRVMRSAKNRYIYFCSHDKKLKRQWLKDLKYPVMPYPKEQNQNYVLGEYIKPTLITDTKRVERKMRLIIYDFEVFSHEWLVVLKDVETGQYTDIYCDNEAFRQAISEDCIYIGFNSKHYDQYIAKGVACDFTPEELKDLNDYIIVKHQQGWQYPAFEGVYWKMNNVDIMDDMQKGLSLKAIEGHLGMNIKESEIDFNIDRKLTSEEIKQTFEYCRHDVDATEAIVKLRKNYLQNKIKVGKLANLSVEKSLSMTNAKLTAAMLRASPKKWTDEREYQYPTDLRREYIPQEVFDFFDKIHEFTIPSEELFKDSLEIVVGECETKIAWGGIHGARRNYIFEEKEPLPGERKRVQENDDVGSFYPHLMTEKGYTSRNIPSPQIFADAVETRMKAKASGDTETANALKLVLNTTYGASLNQYNDLYDPLMGRSVCISGQLYLLELAEHLVQDIEDLTITQLNTDGIMFEFYEDQQADVDVILQEWQDRTHFTLEPDKIARLYQKDVNGYLEVQTNGSVKAKGGYLVKGIAPAGAFNINNNAVIVATAIKEYFLNGTPVEETVNNCNDLSQFQMIAKAGAKYKEAYHLVDGERYSVQKVNRVYATTNERYGKVYKVKDEDDSEAKIESLPEHCLIDNDNQATIEDIDKTFYIEMAKKRINDFKGIKPEKNIRRKNQMATTTKSKETADTSKMNVFQKLLEARAKFLEANVQKSGKNMHLSFKYFELEDIVPVATRIFAEVGLVSIVNFTNDTATMTLVNTDSQDTVSFSAPFNQLSPIVSNTGKQATNEMQALGSSITYMRRYLYMIALDICEPDDVDANLGKDKTPEKAETPKATAPATVEERAEVKEELTAPEENATELQIKGLKKVCKQLKDAQPEKEELIADIAVRTKGFKVISKAQCELLIEKLTFLLEGKEA